jgi:hypothetical protein
MDGIKNNLVLMDPVCVYTKVHHTDRNHKARMYTMD